MKKILFIIALCHIVVMSCAQEKVRSITIQPKIGTTLSLPFGNSKKYLDPNFGFTGGVETEYQIINKWSVSLSIMYTQENSKLNDKDGIFSNLLVRGIRIIDWLNTYYGTHVKYLTGKEETSYINIPIMVNYYVFKDFAIKVGVQPGFQLKCKTSLDLEGNKIKMDTNDFMKSTQNSQSHKFDIAIPFGVSYEYHQFVVDGRYNFGLKRLWDGFNARNRFAQITIGYKFRL